MAQLEPLVFQALTGLVSGRVYPDIAPTNTPRPYITWQQVGGPPMAWTDKSTTPGGFAWLQINVWADTRIQAGVLRKQVEDALILFEGFEARPQDAGTATHEPDLTPPAYGFHQDFEVWYP